VAAVSSVVVALIRGRRLAELISRDLCVARPCGQHRPPGDRPPGRNGGAHVARAASGAARASCDRAAIAGESGAGFRGNVHRGRHTGAAHREPTRGPGARPGSTRSDGLDRVVPCRRRARDRHPRRGGASGSVCTTTHARTHARTHAPHRPAHWLSSLSPAGTQELTADGNRKKKKRTPLNQIGARVRVNELEVTLFRVGGILFAAQEACKHMGGPLSLGDIEVSAPATTQARLPHGL
jgi:hypothetical protein